MSHYGDFQVRGTAGRRRHTGAGPAFVVEKEEEKMTQRDVRRATAAAVLATVLAVGAPAHAATGHAAKAGTSWFQAAVHWVANLLPQGWTGWEKRGYGIDPDGLTPVTPTQSNPDRGYGIDPDG